MTNKFITQSDMDWMLNHKYVDPLELLRIYAAAYKAEKRKAA